MCREVQIFVPGLGCQILSSYHMKVLMKFLDICSGEMRKVRGDTGWVEWMLVPPHV